MALVAGYWLQNIQGQSDIDTQSANSLLKDLGRQLGNITRAFDALQTTEPRLVNQTKKIGSTRQGRKRFRLTDAGLRKVQAMVSSPESIGR